MDPRFYQKIEIFEI